MKYYGKTQGLKVYVESDDIDFRKINISKKRTFYELEYDEENWVIIRGT